METVDLLFNLQKYDDAIKNTRSGLASLEARKRQILDEIAAYESKIASVTAEIRDAGLDTAKNEKEVEVVRTQLDRLGQKFLLIKTEKELSKYNAETEKLTGEIAAGEEKLILLMEKSEALNASLEALKKEARDVSVEFESELGEIEEKIENQRAEIDKLLKHRAEFSRTIPVEHLAMYEKLAAKKNGTAVTIVSKKICSGCHLTISDSVINNAKIKKTPTFCTNCQRIIFLEN